MKHARTVRRKSDEQSKHTLMEACLKPGVSIEQVTNAAAKPWKAVDLYRKAEAVGLGQAYLGLFGGPSHAVHGGWQDLLDYYLDVVDGGFTADLA
ncbi:DUF5677 domain-containing protein [Cupriavidus gilardii]|uniref:DUF5677 domain-containing protein n=1 Tax=Cupriavidus gilardii TaxID=82541 RepID=UPI0021B2910F|nr:DUF5677 domain-containing protein [Cupriavidus gilardii]UXC36637.1 DUF5677 domain-containing protein [Cupriavidus gilardii]